jgi:arsenate reductase (glutaredoxin)
MTVLLFGIPNCDTVKKARTWLSAAKVVYDFVDLRNPPIALETIEAWYKQLGDQMINLRSATYKQLPQAQQHQLKAGDCLDILHRHPTLIKRPILQARQQLLCGFSAAQYAKFFS